MEGEGSRQRYRALRWRALTVGVAGVVLVTAGGFGYVRWSHPAVFDDLTGTEASSTVIGDQRAVGESMAYGMSYARDGQASTGVTVVDARPVVLENTSRATFLIVACSIRRSAGVGAIGAITTRELSQQCVRVVPARGAVMTVTHGRSDQLVLEVTPHRAGVTRVGGLRVTYRAGWQRGTQRLGLPVRVRTR